MKRTYETKLARLCRSQCLLLAGVMSVGSSFAKAVEEGQVQSEANSPAKQTHNLTWQQTRPLLSRCADGLLRKSPLPEYPRPQMVCDDWLNLNGEWDFLDDGSLPPERMYSLGCGLCGSAVPVEMWGITN